MTAPDASGPQRSASSDVLVSHLAGEAVLLNLRDKRYYRLNETAAFIWKGIERGESNDSIVSGLASEFDVKESDARLAVERQVAEFEQRGFFK